MQNLDGSTLGAICMGGFHPIGQKSVPVALVGAGLPLPRLLRQAKPYAARLFHYRDLDRLPDPAARSALVTPAERRGVSQEEDVARMIVSKCGGYPYFIQEYGRALWREVERSPIGVEDFASIRAVIVAELGRRFFRTASSSRRMRSSVI